MIPLHSNTIPNRVTRLKIHGQAPRSELGREWDFDEWRDLGRAKRVMPGKGVSKTFQVIEFHPCVISRGSESSSSSKTTVFERHGPSPDQLYLLESFGRVKCPQNGVAKFFEMREIPNRMEGRNPSLSSRGVPISRIVGWCSPGGHTTT